MLSGLPRPRRFSILYSLAILRHERHRMIPAILAIAFSNLLIVLSVGLLLGVLSIVSVPVDRSSADIWVGYPGVPSVDTGLPIPTHWQSRVLHEPEIERVEMFVQGMVYLGKPGGGVELCWVLGSRLDANALGAFAELTPDLRKELNVPGAIVVDEGDLNYLGLKKGSRTELAGRAVHVVGLVRGLKGLSGSFVLCSLQTARTILRLPEDQTSFLLARCKTAADVVKVLPKLQRYSNMQAKSRDEFSFACRMYWLTRTKVGIAMGCSAILGLLVGAVVASQTLYAAIAAANKEFAVLEAVGIPTWRMVSQAMLISVWVGLLGVVLSVPATLVFASLFRALGTIVDTPLWLMFGSAGLTLIMTILAGVYSIRALRLADPILLLR